MLGDSTTERVTSNPFSGLSRIRYLLYRGCQHGFAILAKMTVTAGTTFMLLGLVYFWAILIDEPLIREGVWILRPSVSHATEFTPQVAEGPIEEWVRLSVKLFEDIKPGARRGLDEGAHALG